MENIDTIIFDVSGVLIDDFYTVWKADIDACEACHVQRIESIEQYKAFFRLPIPEFYKSRGIPNYIIPQLENEWRQAYPKYSDMITLFPEVKSVLKQLVQEKITLAIVSNIPSLFLQEHLERFGIDQYFAIVTGQDDCQEQKPSPKPILITLDKIGSPPEHSGYVGDMAEDIMAGKQARVSTFAISRTNSYHPRWKLEREKPDYLLTNLNELIQIVQIINS